MNLFSYISRTFGRVFRRHREDLLIIALLLAPSVMLVNLQRDATNGNSMRSPPWAATLVQDYSAGRAGDNWKEDVPPIIVNARLLVRLLIEAGQVLSHGHAPVQILNSGVQLVSIWGALFIVFKTSRLIGIPFGWAIASTLLVCTYVPWGFTVYAFATSMPYDLPALFFCAAGTAAILRRQFWSLLVVIAVGTLNKETTIFLIPAYLLSEWIYSFDSKALLFRRATALFAVFAVFYETPRILLQSDQPLLVTASDHAAQAHRWYLNLQTFRLKGATPAENVYWPFFLHIPALLGFRLLPGRLKAIYLATPVLLGPLFLFGNANEFRLLNEIIPLGAISCGWVLYRIFENTSVEEVDLCANR